MESFIAALFFEIVFNDSDVCRFLIHCLQVIRYQYFECPLMSSFACDSEYKIKIQIEGVSKLTVIFICMNFN